MVDATEAEIRHAAVKLIDERNHQLARAIGQRDAALRKLARAETAVAHHRKMLMLAVDEVQVSLPFAGALDEPLSE
jgi:hypothetical protein